MKAAAIYRNKRIFLRTSGIYIYIAYFDISRLSKYPSSHAQIVLIPMHKLFPSIVLDRNIGLVERRRDTGSQTFLNSTYNSFSRLTEECDPIFKPMQKETLYTGSKFIRTRKHCSHFIRYGLVQMKRFESKWK